MNASDRANLRARQIIDDQTLSQNQRVTNAGALLKALSGSVRSGDVKLDDVLSEISDEAVRTAMKAAIEAQLA